MLEYQHFKWSYKRLCIYGSVKHLKFSYKLGGFLCLCNIKSCFQNNINVLLYFSGTLNGGLSTLPGHELGSIVLKDILQKTGVAGKDVSQVILGQIFTAGMYHTIYYSIL